MAFFIDHHSRARAYVDDRLPSSDGYLCLSTYQTDKDVPSTYINVQVDPEKDQHSSSFLFFALYVLYLQCKQWRRPLLASQAFYQQALAFLLPLLALDFLDGETYLHLKRWWIVDRRRLYAHGDVRMCNQAQVDSLWPCDQLQYRQVAKVDVYIHRSGRHVGT